MMLYNNIEITIKQKTKIVLNIINGVKLQDSSINGCVQDQGKSAIFLMTPIH